MLCEAGLRGYAIDGYCVVFCRNPKFYVIHRHYNGRREVKRGMSATARGVRVRADTCRIDGGILLVAFPISGGSKEMWKAVHLCVQPSQSVKGLFVNGYTCTSLPALRAHGQELPILARNSLVTKQSKLQ